MTPSFRIFMILAILLSTLSGKEWRKFTSATGQSFEGRVLSKDSSSVKIERRSDQKTFVLALAKLSQADQDFLKTWKEAPAPTKSIYPPRSEDEKLPKSIYPKTRNLIAARLKEISAREVPKGASGLQAKALNDLNIYRYLSDLNDDVTFSEEESERVQAALKAWNALGNNPITPEVSALFKDTVYLRKGGLIRCVRGAMLSTDSVLDTNRRTRWLMLDPRVEEYGLSEELPIAGIYPVRSGPKLKAKFFAYPSPGFYPVDKLHGKGWTCYGQNIFPKDEKIDVEVFRLNELPTQKIRRNKVQGVQMDVEDTYLYQNSVLFVPLDPETQEAPKKPGVYAVFVKVGGFRVNYIVALF